MARACTVIGSAFLLLGVALALLFVILIARDDHYRQAALVYARNPGNVLYEAEFNGAQAVRAFKVVGIVAGALLAVNGTTLVCLGVVARRAATR